jgi:hypothetical protein
MHWIYAHLIGDYILQNDWMALNKKKKTLPALVHVVVYCVPFLFCSMSWWQIILIGVQHFFQDRTTFIIWFMRVKGSDKFAAGPCSPWSIILTDNIMHILWISFVVWLGTKFL